MIPANVALFALSLAIWSLPANATTTPACQQPTEGSIEALQQDLQLRLSGQRGEADSSSREAVAQVLKQLACFGQAGPNEAGYTLAMSLMSTDQVRDRDEIAAKTVKDWQSKISFDPEKRVTTIPDEIRDAAAFVAWSDIARPEMRGTSTRALIFLAQAISNGHTVELLEFQAYLNSSGSSSYDRQMTKFSAWQFMRFLWVSEKFGQDVEAHYTRAQLEAFEKTLMSSLALPEALKQLNVRQGP